MTVAQWVDAIMPLEKKLTDSPDTLMTRLEAIEPQLNLRPNDGVLRQDWMDTVASLVADRVARGNLEGAARWLQRSVVLIPVDLSLKLNLGAVYLRLSQYKQAQQVLMAALDISPSSVQANELLGLSEYFLGNNSQAIERWNTALAFDSQAPVSGLLQKAGREEAVEAKFKVQQSPHFDLSSNAQTIDVELTRSILEELEDDYNQFSSLFGIQLSSPVPVLLYADQEFRQATNAPHYIEGLNDGKIRIPVHGLSAITPNLAVAIKHELSHTFIRMKSEDRAPRWLQEGMAQYLSIPGLCGSNNPWWGIFRQIDPVPISNLDQLLQPSSGSSDATHAYLEALSIVCYVSETFGEDSLQRILTEVSQSPDFNSALQTEFHDNPQQFETDWRNYLELRSRT